ncbi:N-acetyltransferase [Lentibacillus sp. N15]|uniref:GNAT family N-acetyltransferase n=1 Tax=Lentibacillus songyuanensis TaxID=3136161 RepID=UPI0031BAC843
MTIQKATLRDLQIIKQHARQVRRESIADHDTLLTANHRYSVVSATINSGGYYLVDSNQNKVRGWIGIGRNIDTLSGEIIGFISEIYILPEYREQGIAEKLCNRALCELEDAGLKQVQLQVYVGNAAKQLYQKLGFTDTSVLMTKKLE